MDAATVDTPLYLQLAAHYRQAIASGVLAPGARMPSVRALMRTHRVSLSTALQACRSLEDEGLLEARPRSGYFVLAPRRAVLQPVQEPEPGATAAPPDPAPYSGIHDRISDFVVKCERHPVVTNLALAFGSPECYPQEALKNAALRALRRRPEVLVSPVPPQGDPGFRAVLALRAMAAGMSPTPDEIVVTHGCTEALNLALRAVTQPGDTVAVESPTYFGLLQVIESLGLHALEIPTSPSRGMSVEALELALSTHPQIRAVDKAVIETRLEKWRGLRQPQGVPGITAQEVGAIARFWQSTVPAAKQQIDDALWHEFARLVPSLDLSTRASVWSLLWGEQQELTQQWLKLAHVLHQTSHAGELAAPLSLLVDSFGLPGEGFLTHDGTLDLQDAQETLLHPLNSGEMLNAISIPVDVLAFLTRELVLPVENGALDNVDIIDIPVFEDNRQGKHLHAKKYLCIRSHTELLR